MCFTCLECKITRSESFIMEESPDFQLHGTEKEKTSHRGAPQPLTSHVRSDLRGQSKISNSRNSQTIQDI